MGALWMCCLGFAALAANAPTARGATNECVVLLHGLGRTSWSMMRLERALKDAGYDVVNVSYPSRRWTVERLSNDWLQNLIDIRIPTGAPKVHFVTHSLGSIVVRYYLAHHKFARLGRVVMLGPPNHGSEFSDLLSRSALGRWILRPAGCELQTDANALPDRLGPVDFPLGVIAGDVSINPLSPFVLPSPNDGLVSVASAQVAGMSDFLVVHSTHTWMIRRARTARYVLAFLRNGKFDAGGVRSPQPAVPAPVGRPGRHWAGS